MGVTTRDIYGDAARCAARHPGSYGLAPKGFRLPAGTRVGPVRLQIADLSSPSPTTNAPSASGARQDTTSVLGADLPLVEPKSGWSPARPERGRLVSITSPSCCPIGRRWDASCPRR
jgi:catechol 2,3-dioxygenase